MSSTTSSVPQLSKYCQDTRALPKVEQANKALIGRLESVQLDKHSDSTGGLEDWLELSASEPLGEWQLMEPDQALDSQQGISDHCGEQRNGIDQHILAATTSLEQQRACSADDHWQLLDIPPLVQPPSVLVHLELPTLYSNATRRLLETSLRCWSEAASPALNQPEQLQHVRRHLKPTLKSVEPVTIRHNCYNERASRHWSSRTQSRTASSTAVYSSRLLTQLAVFLRVLFQNQAEPSKQDSQQRAPHDQGNRASYMQCLLDLDAQYAFSDYSLNLLLVGMFSIGVFLMTLSLESLL